MWMFLAIGPRPEGGRGQVGYQGAGGRERRFEISELKCGTRNLKLGMKCKWQNSQNADRKPTVTNHESPVTASLSDSRFASEGGKAPGSSGGCKPGAGG